MLGRSSQRTQVIIENLHLLGWEHGNIHFRHVNKLFVLYWRKAMYQGVCFVCVVLVQKHKHINV